MIPPATASRRRKSGPWEMNETTAIPPDAAQRKTALDTSRSFLVQAPAGSGKTELLTRRFLKLLAEVEQPEQVLAITFTRAATAEMRSRVLGALDRAARLEGADSTDELAVLGAAALQNSSQRGWCLLEQPQRLSIETIDSLSLSITRRTPLLSRLGGSLSPIEKAEPLYQLAARRTLSELGGDRPELSSAIEAFMAARDSNLAECEKLIAGMLEKRDQWGLILPFGSAGAEADDDFWQRMRARLEEPFRRARETLIQDARDLIAGADEIADELAWLISYACGNLEHCDPEAALLGLKETELFEWPAGDSTRNALCNFLLTKAGGWRKRLCEKDGFPNGAAGKPAKERFSALVEELDRREGSLDLVCALREMPPAAYSTEQWQLLKQILLILRHAAAELRVIFSEKEAVDFVEIGMAARQALHDSIDGLESAFVHDWRHLLVDEFQDTSRAQYELLELLMRQWEQDGERHTCFLVGDPMQSIYGFRNAEVELFDLTRRRGLAGLAIESLILKSNFRSHGGLVTPLNEIFSRTFRGNPKSNGSVAFSRSEAVKLAPREGKSVHARMQLHSSAREQSQAGDRHLVEANQAVSIIGQALREALEPEKFQIAVLVRRKKDLLTIARRLREEQIPFHAVEMEELGQRQEILDLLALTRALLHPMDRIAWLSVLRAPWCGLLLRDLHALSGADDPAYAREPMLHLLRSRQALLSADGAARVARITPVLEDGIRGLANQPFLGRWVERVWRALGGMATVTGEQWENIRAFLAAIADVSPSGAGIEQRIARLSAEPDPATTESCGVQLMTIHKAKGLGFDTVLVPGLHNGTGGGSDAPLLAWLERTVSGGPQLGEKELLICPIGIKGQDTDPLYRWIRRLKTKKEKEEAKRVLYVAATRARSELYLMSSVKLSGESLCAHGRNSLLSICWDGLRPLFAEEWEAHPRSAGSIGGSGTYPGGFVTEPPNQTLPLYRFPAGWAAPWDDAAPLRAEAGEVTDSARDRTLFERPRGQMESRAVGVAIHALLEELADAAAGIEVDGMRSQLASWQPRAAALLRAEGLPPELTGRALSAVVTALRSTLDDNVGRWILAAHPGAHAEVSWSQWEDRSLATLRGDRIFRAGPEPLSGGDTHQWIVDYKTAAHTATGLDTFLDQEVERYRPQLAGYGRALRRSGNSLPLRFGLYYPRLKKFRFWEG